MHDIVVTRLNMDPETLHASSELLSPDERRRADRFLSGRDRSLFIATRATLRQLIGSRLGADPASLRFAYGRQGKPSVAGSDVRFNVSRCEDVAVYAFSAGREIGVDVEAIRSLDDADDIVARYFSRYEHHEYRLLDPQERPAGFFNCWTRKEAFVKATGEGLSRPLDAFDVTLKPGTPARIVRVDDAYGACGWSLDSFAPAPGFVAAVVTRGPS